MINKNNNHPVPEEYHEILYIGGIDRRGNIVDFKVPPVVINIKGNINEYKSKMIENHTSIGTLPLLYDKPEPFIILRPTALYYKNYIREMLGKLGVHITDEFPLNNFMKFSDIIYELDPKISFHWKWRIIMQSLHQNGFQDQNQAHVYMIKNQTSLEDCSDVIMEFKRDIRKKMGELPVVIKFNGEPKIGLGIHHLHSPDYEHVSLEYNALMHARLKTSFFTRT